MTRRSSTSVDMLHPEHVALRELVFTLAIPFLALFWIVAMATRGRRRPAIIAVVSLVVGIVSLEASTAIYLGLEERFWGESDWSSLAFLLVGVIAYAMAGFTAWRLSKSEKLRICLAGISRRALWMALVVVCAVIVLGIVAWFTGVPVFALTAAMHVYDFFIYDVAFALENVYMVAVSLPIEFVFNMTGGSAILSMFVWLMITVGAAALTLRAYSWEEGRTVGATSK